MDHLANELLKTDTSIDILSQSLCGLVRVSVESDWRIRGSFY